ncbi:hypothetical protein AVEN_97130-1 [Araneus ventricosus]|uniref:Uncharacterized protein n=1 Tax=Araneus ventricosus TaxID=182803 RepID=A0A4Y2N5H0_ARAVE|nr:hypothetical protein AVEN_97130-1 [Araneus ventricosus]
MHDESSMESGFEPGTLRPLSRDLTTRLDDLVISCTKCPKHGGSSVESGFEPGTLRPQSRDPSTGPPRLVFGDLTL